MSGGDSQLSAEAAAAARDAVARQDSLGYTSMSLGASRDASVQPDSVSQGLSGRLQGEEATGADVRGPGTGAHGSGPANAGGQRQVGVCLPTDCHVSCAGPARVWADVVQAVRELSPSVLFESVCIRALTCMLSMVSARATCYNAG